MTTAAEAAAPFPWTEEATSDPHRRRVRAHIGGLHCSLCTGTIEHALGRLPGVHAVAVSLTHEQALVEFDPARTGAADLMRALTDIGHTLSDPRKLEPFEAQERAPVRERDRFVGAFAASLAAIGLVANPAGGWALALSGVVFASLVAFAYAVLRSAGRVRAVLGATALAAAGVALFVLRAGGGFADLAPWITAILALGVVLGLARHVLRMAVQALRRGILNQYVLVEIGIPLAATGLVYPVWAMVAMAVSVTALFSNSLWGRPGLFLDAAASVGHTPRTRAHST